MIARRKKLSHAELREIAIAASDDGFWEAGVNNEQPRLYAIMGWNAQPRQRLICYGIEKWPQAQHIAAFDPETVLELLDKIQEL